MIRRQSIYAIILTLFCVAALQAGCASSPQTNFYTLAAMAKAEQGGTPPSYSVTVYRVTLPEYLDRPQLVRTMDGNRLQISEFHRWAEPLKSLIPRQMAENISRLLGTEQVSFYPQNASGYADYRIFADFQRFEASDKAVTLDALWSIRTATGETLKSGRSKIQEPITPGGEENLISGYGLALAGFSREIVKAMPASSQAESSGSLKK